MGKKKKIRQRGKIRLSSYFKKFNVGDSVAVVLDLGVKASFPKRIQGSVGKIISESGMYKLIELKDGNKVKKFIIHPVHLKKI
jgi:ribosomal protein L21E